MADKFITGRMAGHELHPPPIMSKLEQPSLGANRTITAKSVPALRTERSGICKRYDEPAVTNSAKF
jgi:hypothetical protein